jgi:hypothetical protein
MSEPTDSEKQVQLDNGDSSYIKGMKIATSKGHTSSRKSHVTREFVRKPNSQPMSSHSQAEPECPECRTSTNLSVDEDNWLACSCGLQIEPADIFVSERSSSEFDSTISSGVGHGDAIGIGHKLTGSVISGHKDHAGNAVGKAWMHRAGIRGKLDSRSRAVLEGTRARRAVMRMIRENTPDQPTLRAEALHNFSVGWPEPRKCSADFITIGQVSHPVPRESSAAACIFVAAERMGISKPAHQLISDIFDLNNITFGLAEKYLRRAIKCLRQHLGPRARKEATDSRLDAVLDSAFGRQNRLGKIHQRVRRFCLFWAEYSGESRVLDSPASYAACAAYEIAKVDDLGLTLEDIETAFQVSQGFRAKRSEVRDLLAFIESHPGVLE